MGTATFAVRIAYDEAMNSNINPVVTFTPNVAGTLTYDAAWSWWTSDRTFKAAFDVVDADVYVPHVGIVVAGARDAAGNVQAPYNGTDNFSINTLTTPATVVSAIPSVTEVTRINVGSSQTPPTNAGFAVRITYGGPMNTSSAPFADLHARRGRCADLRPRTELVGQRYDLQGRLRRGRRGRERCGD